MHMTEKKVWFITGAGRGMGVDIARAAVAAGNAVVATECNPDAVAEAVGDADDLLVVKLDVTSRADAEAAVQAAVQIRSDSVSGSPHVHTWVNVARPS